MASPDIALPFLSSVPGTDSRESGANPELPRSGIENKSHLEALAMKLGSGGE
jgi:hypothetical protein